MFLAKLEGYGIRGSFLKWTESYLNRRGFIVRIGNSTSKVFDMLLGVHRDPICRRFFSHYF